MLRTIRLALALSLLAGAPLAAALLPEALGEFVRKSAEPVQPAEAELAEEWGFEAAERAVYETPNGRRATLTATRYYDDTGAYAAFLWTRPRGGEPAEHGKRAWRGAGGETLMQLGNYLVEMEGAPPEDEHVELMLAYLPRIRVTVDPPVLAYRPSRGEVAGTERHILGPAALERLAPEIAPSVAGFHFGAEAHYAEYESPAGPIRMAIFAYPTLQMARAQAEEFFQAPGVTAKRTGPLVAAVIAPPSADEAQKLLARVRYEAEVTLDYSEPKRHDDAYTLLMDVVKLVGILVLLCIVGGALVAGVRRLAGRVAPNSLLAPREGDGLTRLNIEEPPWRRR